jgi:hypothetical protein
MTYLSTHAKIEICRAILLGEEAGTAAFEKHSVSDLDKLLLRRQSHQAMKHIVKVHHPLKGYFSASIKNPMRTNIAIAALVTTFAIAGLITTVEHINWADPTTFSLAGAAAGFLAVAAATAGWTVSSWIAYRNSRVQQTINFVAHRFTHDTFNQNVRTINDHLRGQRIDSALMDRLAISSDEKDRDALQAVRYIVNYFEFLSVCILSGNFDEEIIRKVMRGNLVFYFDRCLPWISELQAKNPKTLEHFTTMRAHFKEI